MGNRRRIKKELGKSKGITKKEEMKMKKFLGYVCVVVWAVVVFGVSVLLGREADPFDVVWFWSVCGLVTLSAVLHFQKKKLLHKNTENWKRRLRQSEDGLFAVIGRQEKINNGLLDTIAAMEKKHDFDRRVADREVANYLGENVELKKVLYGTKKVKKVKRKLEVRNQKLENGTFQGAGK